MGAIFSKLRFKYRSKKLKDSPPLKCNDVSKSSHMSSIERIKHFLSCRLFKFYKLKLRLNNKGTYDSEPNIMSNSDMNIEMTETKHLMNLSQESLEAIDLLYYDDVIDFGEVTWVNEDDDSSTESLLGTKYERNIIEEMNVYLLGDQTMGDIHEHIMKKITEHYRSIYLNEITMDTQIVRSISPVASLNKDGLFILSSGTLTENRVKSSDLSLLIAIVTNDWNKCLNLVSEGYPSQCEITVPGKNDAVEVICVSPLHISCLFRRPKIMEIFLQKGADPNAESTSGLSPIHLLVDDNLYRNYVKEKLWNPILLNEISKCEDRGKRPDSPYVITSCNYFLETMNIYRSLLNRHSNNTLECLSLLLSYGADFEMRDNYGQTPLIRAICHGDENMETVKALLESTLVNIFALDRYGRSLLHYLCNKNICSEKNLSILNYLLVNGCKINCPDILGNTPLHDASRCGNAQIIELLLEYGGNPDIKNVSGESALFIFFNMPINNNKNEILLKLLNESTQVCVYDKLGKIPYLLHEPYINKITKSMLEISSTPFALKRYCRQIIRRFIGPLHLKEKMMTDTFNYPLHLKNYIIDEIYFST